MKEGDHSKAEATIRLYRSEDRERIRWICCETGFLGKPVDPVFEDRELFADFLTSYYTDEEPDCAVVLEVGGEIMGYILGARHPGRQSSYNWKRLPNRLARIMKGYLGSYRQTTREYINWLLWRGWREVPETPSGMAHLHINLLPAYKNVHQTREMVEFFLKLLAGYGEKAVYGQVVTFSDRRGKRTFARYGFDVIDSVEVTKFRKYSDRKIYLFTIVKDLSETFALYGEDIWKNREDKK